ncbi:MAG: hypothetical protein IPL16_15435 [Ignavibacteria bacterium]|nr:hypothetical protein [Ignavibacteria bacterium]
MSEIKKKQVQAYNIDIFFDSKATEITDVFLDYGDRESVYDKFINFLIKPIRLSSDEARKKPAFGD